MDAPDEMVEAVAQAFMEAWWANSLHAPTDWDRMTAHARQAYLDWDRMTAHARQAYLDGARAVLSVPALAEVIARDAKVRGLAEDIVWLAKLAQGSSWPGEMADRVQRAADRVVSDLGSDADRAAIAALRQMGSE